MERVIMRHTTSSRARGLAACLLIAAPVFAQQAPPQDPLVKEGATVKLAEHTYAIPDGNVGLVPNVGIVVGSRATLVIDPGLGRRNGEAVLREVAKVSRNTEIYIASTHFHAEHTTGYVAFPASAKYVNSTVQEAEFAQGGAQLIKTFSGRSPMTAELLKDAVGRKADITFDRDYTARSRRRPRALSRGRPDSHARRHGVLRGRRRRPVLRRRRDEQLVPGGEPGVEHEGVAGGVRRLRGDEAEDHRTRRTAPSVQGSIIAANREIMLNVQRACARAEGSGPFGRRNGYRRAGRDCGHAPAVAPRQRPRLSGPRRVRGSTITNCKS